MLGPVAFITAFAFTLNSLPVSSSLTLAPIIREIPSKSYKKRNRILLSLFFIDNLSLGKCLTARFTLSVFSSMTFTWFAIVAPNRVAVNAIPIFILASLCWPTVCKKIVIRIRQKIYQYV